MDRRALNIDKNIDYIKKLLKETRKSIDLFSGFMEKNKMIYEAYKLFKIKYKGNFSKTEIRLHHFMVK